MSLFTEDILRARFRNNITKSNYETFESKAQNLLNENIQEQHNFSSTQKVYDIFLSHSSGDAEIVIGLKLTIEDLGHSVYVDWIEDPKLNRAQVTKATAATLKTRMKQCKSLVYAFSENASNSKWMPWELGYFDGIKGTAAVLPISKAAKSNFQGSEYLGLYYYIDIDIDTTQGGSKKVLWVSESSTKYVQFNLWLSGNQPTQR